MFNAKEIGQRVRVLRMRRGITLESLAEQLHCSRSHISQAERGVRSYSIDLLIDIAAFFDVSLDYLILGKPAVDGQTRRELLQIVQELLAIANQ
ncbi:helix-turn-helix domain-containing protein [Oribacterium sp. HCP28S3_H8]|uniref:helix-turn-helix domain-containing protein n=1 Tax=Oribacterium sp. HCP28S3_H8 TaxID=3438945 RepID=UPI0030653180|nr:helix-turn-helix transcriptional regulator [Lachnospiraceae bacterium]